MQVTLTLGDAALSLLIGAIGSLVAAYIYSRGPTWVHSSSIRWAERSRRSAHTRIARNTSELDQIAELKENPSMFIGWFGSRLALLILLAVLFIFFDAGLNLSVMKWRTVTNPGEPKCAIEAFFGWTCAGPELRTYALVFFQGIELFCFYIIMRVSRQCFRYRNLNVLTESIVTDIERLTKRWPESD